MGETTGIAWTDSTVNAWHGCEKVSAGCRNCYAAESTPVRVKRAKGLEVWGRDAARSETKGWRTDLRRWNRQAEAAALDPDLVGRPHRVFAQSLADTFENYAGARVLRADGGMQGQLADLRAEFLSVVEECSALTFQILTKRPEHILGMVPVSWRKKWPAHVWIGCTVEDQENADRRIPELLALPPSAVKFLSVEPQVGPVDLSWWLECMMCRRCGVAQVPVMDAPTCRCPTTDDGEPTSDFRRGMLDWVIQGGESGHKARPFDLAWARSLRDQCRAAGVPYFLKQLGARPIFPSAQCDGWKPLHLSDSHGGDESEWPADLQNCRAFPEGGPRG